MEDLGNFIPIMRSKWGAGGVTSCDYSLILSFWVLLGTGLEEDKNGGQLGDRFRHPDNKQWYYPYSSLDGQC